MYLIFKKIRNAKIQKPFTNLLVLKFEPKLILKPSIKNTNTK